jgi:hypothetical protein
MLNHHPNVSAQPHIRFGDNRSTEITLSCGTIFRQKGMGLLPRTFAATITIVIVTAVAAAMAMMSALPTAQPHNTSRSSS